MKTMLKGAIYGISLVLLVQAICMIAEGSVAGAVSFIAFMLVGVYFLTSESIAEMFLCGFTAIFAMFALQIQFLNMGIGDAGGYSILEAYVYGLGGTTAAVCVATILTLLKKHGKLKRRIVNMEQYDFSKEHKIKLIIYAVLTAASFAGLALADNSALGILLFGVIQGVMLFFVIPERKRIILFVPILVLTANYFISANDIWHVSNVFVIALLYSLMLAQIDIKKPSCEFIEELINRFFAPFSKLVVPFRWGAELKGEGSNDRAKRVLIAAAVSIVSVVLLCVALSGADMVFSHMMGDITANIGEMFSFATIFKILAGVGVGLYLFGVIHSAFEEYEPTEWKSRKGDLIIIGGVLISILAVYTVFVIIQFRYLFAAAQLPYGLNVTEYARRGFFELLGLSCVNIIIILTVMSLTKHVYGGRLKLIKGLNMYLCSVTGVLLASSFYRMWLYTETDGLTRLRFLVFGFLLFEAVGLVITFFYIAKPKFNIVMVYMAIALCYYLVLNIVPIDALIAKNQVDRYLTGEREEISYVLTLSPDAAEALERVYRESDDVNIKARAYDWLKRMAQDESGDWRSFNLSEHRVKSVYAKIKTAP